MLLLPWALLGIPCLGSTAPTEQKPLLPEGHQVGDSGNPQLVIGGRPLQGKFLQITDLHPDPFYETHSSSEKEDACHRGSGPAGILGAETTDCDSPISLINATFKWIEENLKDSVDFVIWTGDSARHDNDESIPRTVEQVLDLNRMMVAKIVEVFGKKDNENDTDPTNDLIIPIIPTFGNNDILPHNIFHPGPNLWTMKYLDIWRKFIPEAQRHGFARGGWFYIEVIPDKLVVFSLNTLYFFDNNSAVDGCADPSQPGWEHMRWLQIQLRIVRERGMKAMLIGHVPPARTESKSSWDESCWQKYTLWMHQYRDIIVGSIYGHMNIDHFLLQDSEDVESLLPSSETNLTSRNSLGDRMTIESTSEYLTELRTDWSRLPEPPHSKSLRYSNNIEEVGNIGGFTDASRKKVGLNKKSKKDKFFERIGGRWGERYSVSLVSPSVVPNYFPTIRVYEYNISGLEGSIVSGAQQSRAENSLQDEQLVDKILTSQKVSFEEEENSREEKTGTGVNIPRISRSHTPKGPSKASPPGPAYSPQTLTLLGYTQYYANLTNINNDFVNDSSMYMDSNRIESNGWKDGKHHGKHPGNRNAEPHPKMFKYQIEYDTRQDKVFGLKDLTVRSYIDLAARIGHYKPSRGDSFDTQESQDGESLGEIDQSSKDNAQSIEMNDGDLTPSDKKYEDKKEKKKKKKHGKNGKHKKRKALNRVWFEFVKRAFVGSRDEQDLHEEFGQPIDNP